MARFATVVALSTLFISLSGCAKEWTRPGTTEQQLNADKLSCEQQALTSYPVVHEAPLTYRPTASSKLDTSCVEQSGLNNCDPAGNVGTPPAAGHNDANDFDRDAAVKACLASKGYTYKKATP